MQTFSLNTAFSCAKVLIFFIFFALLINALVDGPFKRMANITTEIVEDTISVEDLEAMGLDPSPDLTVCRSPGYNPFLRNEGNLHFYDQIEHVFDKVEVGIGVNIRATNKSSINLKAPPFRRVISDWFYFGFCYTTSPKTLFIMDGCDDKDPTSLATRSIVASFVSLDNITQYAFYVHDKDEELMYNGLTNIAEAEVSANMFDSGQSTVYHITTEYHHRISDCDDTGRTLSECVTEHLNRKYGNCSINAEDEQSSCSVASFNGKVTDTYTLKFDGLQRIRTDTNCSLPCKRFVHKVTKSIEARTKDMYFLQGTTNHLKTVLVLRYHRQQRYKRVKEVYTYSWGYLFSDFGGTMGLFLGLSLWDLANKALDLLKQVLVAKKLI